jgi:hypothetical protein
MVDEMPMAEYAFSYGLTAMNIAGLSMPYVLATRLDSSNVLHHFKCTPPGY